MKLSAGFVTLAFAAFSAVSGAEFEKRTKGINDVTILNYALTLEHLEAAFYRDGLKKFSPAAFTAAGYPAYVRERIEMLAEEEAIHVTTLAGALGKSATKPCTYNFGAGYSSVDNFLGLAKVLESVGVSAYLGAAPDISSDAYLTVAASIYGIEARHEAIVNEYLGVSGAPSPFETPLGYSNVYTLAAQFIKSCPKSNPALPVTAFPALTVSKGTVKPGNTITLSFKKQKGKKAYYAHFLNQLSDVVVKVGAEGQVKVPKGITGQAYIVVTNCRTLGDAGTVAGPFQFSVDKAN